MRYPIRLSSITVLLAFTAFAGCGGGNGPSPVSPPSPTPAPPPARIVVLQGGIEIPVDYHYEWWFTTPRGGTLDITVDWTFADSVVWVYLAQGTCTEAQIQAGQCQYIIQSLVSAPKPRVLTLPNAAAGPYTLLIYNGSKRPESVAFTVGLTG
jgi:hypothetical protein